MTSQVINAFCVHPGCRREVQEVQGSGTFGNIRQDNCNEIRTNSTHDCNEENEAVLMSHTSLILPDPGSGIVAIMSLMIRLSEYAHLRIDTGAPQREIPVAAVSGN